MDDDTTPPPARPNQFKDRVVIVSGAAGKLGSVICKALYKSGAQLVANDVNAEALSSLVSDLQSLPVHGTILPVAISAINGTEIISKTIQRFGSVHAIINTTLGAVSWTNFEDTTDSAFRNAFESNVLGPLSITRAAWPHFKAQRFGRVVNFTSDSMLGFPTASSYTFSKGALMGVNKTLAMEGAPHNIKVNCVSPIAFVPRMSRHIENFSKDVQEAFWTRYAPEGNVPMILALASEQCGVSGEAFTTSGMAVGRCTLSYVEGQREMRTVDECLEKIPLLCGKGAREVFEPESMVDFTEWQAKYVLGK